MEMMKKKILLTVLASLSLWGIVKADEGMWLPLFIERTNEVDMHKLGLQLSATEIYNEGKPSLKDAIVQFGRGCTGEMVSANGLLLTNHHCGYPQIQAHSTVEHDYLSDGFWAKTLNDELPNEGLTVKFLVRMEDVSKEVLSKLNDQMTETERNMEVSKISKTIATQAEENGKYVTAVLPLFDGNEYYLYVYEEFLDVRLVGTPPNSIGKFGADADNWMWPRHTGDFSVFRVYADKDGKPAKYSPDNVPYKPKHFLPVSLEGVKKGDFAMIMGYPGSTDRYSTSFNVQQLIDTKAPLTVKIRAHKLDILKQAMDADPKVRIQYSSKYAGTANYWKYFIGQEKQLKQNNVLAKKQTLEKEFTAWSANKPRYKNVLSEMAQDYATLQDYENLKICTQEAIIRGSDIFTFTSVFNNLYKSLEKGDTAAVSSWITKAKTIYVPEFFRDFNLALDAQVMAKMLVLYSENVPEHMLPEEWIKKMSKNKDDYKKWVDEIYAKSFFADEKKLMTFLDKPDMKELAADPAMMWFKIFMNHLDHKKDHATLDRLEKNKRLFIDGLRKMQAEKKFAPDANLTMRFTYGQVLDYEPADAVSYDFKTTLKGVMEKEDPNNPDFVVPEKLKELYNAKDYGIYGGDELVTCFLSNTDITGGNSGSPVLNSKGELIGLAFDGNWEAMSGDIFFEPQLQRTISVDIRYVLFIIDKFAGSSRLIEELQFNAK